MISSIILGVAVLFVAAYFSYGRFLARHLQLDPTRVTPAQAVNDGVDFVTAGKKFLLGQHFSASPPRDPSWGRS